MARNFASYHDLWPTSQELLHRTLRGAMAKLSVHPAALDAVVRQVVASLLEATLSPPLPADIVSNRDLHVSARCMQ